MPEMSSEDRFFIVNTDKRAITEYRSKTPSLHNIAVAGDGKSFAVLASDGRKHGLKILRCVTGGDCVSLASFQKKMISSLSLSHDGRTLYYSVLNVPGFEERPKDFKFFDEFEVSKFPSNLYAGPNRFHHDIWRMDMRTGTSVRTHSDLPLGGPVFALDDGVAFNGFAEAEMAQRYQARYAGTYSDPLILMLGVPIICLTGKSCTLMDVVPENSDAPARMIDAAKAGDVALLAGTDSTRALAGHGYVQSYAVRKNGAVKTHSAAGVVQGVALTYDLESDAAYRLTDRRFFSDMPALPKPAPNASPPGAEWIIQKDHAGKIDTLDLANYSYSIRNID